MRIQDLPDFIQNYLSNDTPIDEPVAKRTRLQYANKGTPQRVAEYFLEHQDQLSKLKASDRYLIAKKVHLDSQSKTAEPIVKVFDASILPLLKLSDFKKALEERNYDLAFAILDRIPDSKQKTFEASLISWSEKIRSRDEDLPPQYRDRDLAFYQFIGKAQMAIDPLGDSVIGPFKESGGSLIHKEVVAVNKMATYHLPLEMKIYFRPGIWIEEGDDEILANLFNKELDGFELSLKDANRILQSSTLRHLVVKSPFFLNWIAKFADQKPLWFEMFIPHLGIMIDFSQLCDPLKDDQDPTMRLDFLEACLRLHPSLKMPIKDLLIQLPSLLRVNYPPLYRETILSRLDIPAEFVFESGSTSVVEHYLDTHPGKVNQKLLELYLVNPHFSPELFHRAFDVPQELVDSTLSGTIETNLFLKVFELHPEIIVEILENFQETISQDQKRIYLKLHLENYEGLSNSQLCIPLIRFCYASEKIPESFFLDVLNAAKYKEGDLKRLIEAFPESLETIKSTISKINPHPLVIKDLLMIFEKDLFEEGNTIFHLLAPRLPINSFYLLFNFRPDHFDYHSNQLTIRNQNSKTPLDLIDLKGVAHLPAFGNYSRFFQTTTPLLYWAINEHRGFKIFIQNEPHLMECFKRPFKYPSSQKDAMETDHLDVDSFYKVLEDFSDQELLILKTRGLELDPLLTDSKGNTLYHVHDSIYIPESAFGIENLDGETPLWNPGLSTVQSLIERGIDLFHRSKDGSNFLHSLLLEIDDLIKLLEIVPQDAFKALLYQSNLKGDTPFKLLAREVESFDVLEKYADKENPSHKAILLNQLLLLESTNRVNHRSVSLPEDILTLKQEMMDQVISDLETYKPYLYANEHLLRNLLVHHKDLFSREELIASLDHQPPLPMIENFFGEDEQEQLKLPTQNPAWIAQRTSEEKMAVLPLLPPDEIPAVVGGTLPEEELEELDIYLAKVISTMREAEGSENWIEWFNTTQEDLYTLTLEQTAVLTNIRTEALIELLPYFRPIQQAVIIPLLPRDLLNVHLQKMPYERIHELLRYATLEQKREFFKQFNLMHPLFLEWNPEEWKGRFKEEFTPTYLKLMQFTQDNIRIDGVLVTKDINVPLHQTEQLRNAFIKYTTDPERLFYLQKFREVEERIKEIQNEAEVLFPSLSSNEILIPDEFKDILFGELMTNPIRLPGGNVCIDLETWKKYQEEEDRINPTRRNPLPKGMIRHPMDGSIVSLDLFRPDADLAQRIALWKRQTI